MSSRNRKEAKSKSSRKDRKKGKKEEPPQEEETEVPPEPIVVEPSLWEKVAAVWELPEAEQRAAIATLFEKKDGPGVCREAIELDHTLLDLKFAQESGFNLQQTRAFYELTVKLYEKIADPLKEHSAADVFAYFKELVLTNSVTVHADPTNKYNPVNKPPEPEKVNESDEERDEEGREDEEKEQETKKKPTTGRKSGRGKSSPKQEEKEKKRGGDSSSRNPKVSTRGKHKTDKHIAQEAEAKPEPAPEPEPEKVSMMSLFTAQNVRNISDYLTKGLFAHFLLYQAVYNTKLFQPRRNVIVQPLQVETVVPEVFSLSNAIDVEAEEKVKREQFVEQNEEELSAAGASLTADPFKPEPVPLDPKDQIALVVKEHIDRAKSEMEKMIQANREQLEKRLATVETKPGKKKK